MLLKQLQVFRCCLKVGLMAQININMGQKLVGTEDLFLVLIIVKNKMLKLTKCHRSCAASVWPVGCVISVAAHVKRPSGSLSH